MSATVQGRGRSEAQDGEDKEVREDCKIHCVMEVLYILSLRRLLRSSSAVVSEFGSDRFETETGRFYLYEKQGSTTQAITVKKPRNGT